MDIKINLIRDEITQFGLGGAYLLATLRNLQEEYGTPDGVQISYPELQSHMGSSHSTAGMMKIVKRLKEAGKLQTKAKYNKMNIVNLVFTIME